MSRVCADPGQEEGEKSPWESVEKSAEKLVFRQAETGQKSEEAKPSTSYNLKDKDDSYEQC